MRCKCGYDFARAMLEWMQREDDKGDRPFVSYAVVDGRDYQVFRKREMKVVACGRADERRRIAAMGEAAEIVGNLMCCPECKRVTFNAPRAEEPRYLLAEA